MGIRAPQESGAIRQRPDRLHSFARHGPRRHPAWEEEYTPIFDRQALIIDVRHNRGGSIDSWLLGKLERKAWMYWQPRHGLTIWNMQGAFRGPLIVLCDQLTASDGEAFSEGFRRLGLGKVLG